ncbi:hypothetical protein CEE55_22425 [Stenotrophomonas pavanii]|uniref:Uncharacterized protein n=1 Tax=Stenotrophomonas pavanii TaxID=487698 RepID=A0A246KQI5_9GAMM|nr:hypothetical protein [Stenotrophomonas pavanii]OWR25640.1 hypothetical protein CEE55_22425 [Stenotrophomonas pavanii]
MDAERLDDLRELIGEYWCLAFAEGQEGRNTDTTDGAAQRCICAIEAIIREARTALTPPEGDMGNPISVPDGFVLVPVEPTEKMQRAGAGITCTNVDEAWEVWHAMLAARPEVP